MDPSTTSPVPPAHPAPLDPVLLADLAARCPASPPISIPSPRAGADPAGHVDQVADPADRDVVPAVPAPVDPVGRGAVHADHVPFRTAVPAASRCRRVRLSRLHVDHVLLAGLADRLAIAPAVLVDPADPVRRPVLMNHPSADPATRAPQLPGTPTAVQLVPAVLKCPAVPVAPARIIYMRIARCQKPVPCGPTCLSRPLDSDAEYHIVFDVLLIITTKSL